MSDLDTRARAATRELLDSSAPDTARRYAELHRTRTRRTATKLVAAAAVVALGAGGWWLGNGHQREVEPASPAGFHNGALVGQHDVSSAASAGWGTVYGPKPASLPDDAANDEPFLQWSARGTLLYYEDQQRELAAWDTDTGTKRVLMTCPKRGCLGGAVSPDGSQAAFLGDGAIIIADLATGKTQPVPAGGAQGGPLQWSPDGRTLAFADQLGLWTVDVAGGGSPRLVRQAGYSTDDAGYSVAWSPDGTRIAWFDVAEDDQHSGGHFTLTTVRPDGSDLQVVHDAGYCECARQLPPSVAWSPDGTELAVTTSDLDQTPGVYTVHPDGSDWTLRKAGDWSWLTWRPLAG